jgi:uncharacterized membrane protein
MGEKTAHPAQRNVSTVSRLEQEALRGRSWAECISDVLTKAVGSLTSITLHVSCYGLWVLVNTGVIPLIKPFDPFPFGILTLIVSSEGVLLALIILISQNRMIRQADRRAHLDLQVNLLAEQESTAVLKILRRIARQMGVADDAVENQVNNLTQQTDIDAMMHNLEKQLPKE